MICAEFFTSHSGSLLGFHIHGHSGMAEAGSDVLCAFVSSAAYMAANTITEILGIDAQATDGEGDMLVRVKENDAEACRVVLEGLLLHLKNTEEQYPKFLKVTHTEVSYHA